MTKLTQIDDPWSDGFFVVHIFDDGSTAWWCVDPETGAADLIEPVCQDADNELDT